MKPELQTPKDTTVYITPTLGQRVVVLGQRRSMSLLESCTNIAIGYGIALATQAIVFPIFGLEATTADHFGIAAIFTVVSLARSYLLRRLFNYWHISAARSKAQ